MVLWMLIEDCRRDVANANACLASLCLPGVHFLPDCKGGVCRKCRHPLRRTSHGHLPGHAASPVGLQFYTLLFSFSRRIKTSSLPNRRRCAQVRITALLPLVIFTLLLADIVK